MIIQKKIGILESVGTEVRYFFSSPDGRLFDDRSNAETHTYDLLVGSDRAYASVNDIWSDIDKLVKEVAYPVTEFQAKGTESNAQIYFDSTSQSYRLGVLILKTLLFVEVLSWVISKHLQIQM